MTTFSDHLQRVVQRHSLTTIEAEDAMRRILSGEVSPVQLAGFLIALKMNGETPEELLGFATAMRQAMIRVDAGPGPALDTCGTGGDGANTFNISTAAAFVVAGAGVKVAKHGNRSATSQCGSADVLEALGGRVELAPERMGESIRETGMGFLFARLLHPAMRHAAPVRAELKIRTVFNLLGPLANPAGAEAHLIGAPSEGYARSMAIAITALGVRKAFVVHGSDGLDEITTSGSTSVYIVENDQWRMEPWSPADFGVPYASLEDLRGGDRDVNAAMIHGILQGERGPRRDIVLVNAAAGLVAVGAAADIREGMQAAADSIDSGAAARTLRRWVEFTNS